MADDLADFPIVVLESDSPEQVGKLGLFDLLMPVGNTGLVFTAAVPGVLMFAGPIFAEPVRRAANLRAATTLIHMGLISGDSLTFIRQALGQSPQEVADMAGVSLANAVGWENNIETVPLQVWASLAQKACEVDGRIMPVHHAFRADWRPRLIRVFPNIPMRGVSSVPDFGVSASPYTDQPFSNIPGAECYPLPNC